MACPTTTQLALFLTTFGLDDKERTAIDRHLAGCFVCQEKINQIKQYLQDRQSENEQECDEIRDDLEAVALGRATLAQAECVQRHTNECHACEVLLAIMPTDFSYETVRQFDILLSPDFDRKIGSAVDQKLGLASPYHDVDRVERKARDPVEGAREFVTNIRFFLTPFEPAPGFRGVKEAPKSDFKKIEHKGGDIVIEVGKAGIIVELYSKREKYLDDNESDETKKVVFPGMKPGIYKIRVVRHYFDANHSNSA